MGNELMIWRVSIGCFYNKLHGYRCPRSITCKFHLDISLFLLSVLRAVHSCIGVANIFFVESVYTLQTALVVAALVLLGGDVETNPGPTTGEHCISILHCNIRSIRNKLEFIKDNFTDFDILCFTETHLNISFPTEDLKLSDNFCNPFRKDRTNHGGGILVYLSNSLIQKRRTDLEIYWEECIWLETRINNAKSLLGVFYSPKTSDETFF